ncbi:MAG: chitobiase/beta-hexosaminidase C-terminal domain-containing protein, partial [Oscillospiraceae bacterium]|nr:chitobiase/beta-hexosaminidase C-terminal domain-containing protein [Oscillospiraceae bacterium]
MKRKSILTAIVLFGILLSVFSGGAARSEISVSADSASEPLEVTFSHESGFYSTSFELTLTATDESADIYFTTNGSAPTITSVKYSGSIPVIVLGDVDVLSVKAIAVKGAETSKEFTRNFVKGANVHSRFGEDTLVFVLSGEDNDFWGYENGILRVDGGIDRANWIAQETIRLGRPPRPGPDYMGGEINPDKPANFNRKTHTSERRVYLEMFDSSGNSYISRGAGVRVKGGWSRAHNQKSLEFYANDGRDEDGNAINNGYFNYPFFYENSEDGNIINRYRRFRLRNGGGQRTGCFVRDELGADLLRQAGFPDTQMHVPAAVFLNGEYYGVRWLKTPKTENHLRHRYGGVTERFWYMSGGENYNKGQEE